MTLKCGLSSSLALNFLWLFLWDFLIVFFPLIWSLTRSHALFKERRNVKIICTRHCCSKYRFNSKGILVRNQSFEKKWSEKLSQIWRKWMFESWNSSVDRKICKVKWLYASECVCAWKSIKLSHNIACNAIEDTKKVNPEVLQCLHFVTVLLSLFLVLLK